MKRILKISFWLSNPLVGLLIPTLYVLILFASGIMSISASLIDNGSMVYFIGVTSAMMVVMYLKLRKKSALILRDERADDFVGQSTFRKIALLGFLSGVFIALDYYLTIPYQSFNMIAVRLYMPNRVPTMLAYIGNLLIPFSSMALGLTILFFDKYNKLSRIIGFVVGIGVPVLAALGLGGRGRIFDLMVLIPWWMLQRPVWGYPILPRGAVTRLGILLVVAVGLWSLFAISKVRSPFGEEQYELAIKFSSPLVTPSDQTVQILGKLNPTIANGVIESLFYWTHSVPVFDLIYNQWDLSPDLVGVISPVVYRRLETFGIVPSSIEIKENYNRITTSRGVPSNVFTTVLSSIIISFGRIGGIAFTLILSWFSCSIFIASRKKRQFIYTYLSSILFLSFFLWFQFSTTRYPIYEYGIYYAVVFMLLPRRRK